MNEETGSGARPEVDANRAPSGAPIAPAPTVHP